MADDRRPRGMLNAIGLANVGLERFIAEKLPDAANARHGDVIGSIAGHSIDDYVAVAERSTRPPEALPLVELNVSCPNTADGLQFGEHPGTSARASGAVRPVLWSGRR